MRRKIIKIIIVFLCMSTIFYFSSESGSRSSKKSNHTIDIIYKVITKKKIDKTTREKYETPIRKSAHFLLYFLLGLSIISLLSEYSISLNKSIILGITIVLLYSISDEVHQLFVNGRSCEIRDVLIDTIGGSSAILIYKNIKRRKKHE